MSEKVRDRKNRWRAITIAFRASPEENELLNSFKDVDLIIENVLKNSFISH